VIRAGSFASVNDLVRHTETYLVERNANPKPYKRKAKGAEILSKLKRARAARHVHRLIIALEDGDSYSGRVYRLVSFQPMRRAV
jgi:hypothetical protein